MSVDLIGLLDTSASITAEEQRRRPNYWATNPRALLSTCNVSRLTFGTGADIYRSVQPILENTQQELILVTCFWARSESLETVCSVLRSLSRKGLEKGAPIRVRICLSSVSFLQKILHTQSLDGYIYPPPTWQSKLGLPGPDELQGLDLSIKSIFVKPFSVMHPKFIIVDRREILLPSCNVSWENWFEGCIGMTGDVVQQFVRFWQDFWAESNDVGGGDGADLAQVVNAPTADSQSQRSEPSAAVGHLFRQRDAALSNLIADLKSASIQCAFLPSPHNINPRFRFLPWQKAAPAPRSPLNRFVMSALRLAERRVYMQTPNLTCPPVLAAILDTLQRGVDIHIVTSERLMILEQLGTAGTTTSRCVKKLVKRYQSMHDSSITASSNMDGLAEEGRVKAVGKLRIEYYLPSYGGSYEGDLGTIPSANAEPVQSHLKLTVIDDELVILGSGNMDRASWYTSQELGVAFSSPQLARGIEKRLTGVLEKRKKLVFDSSVKG